LGLQWLRPEERMADKRKAIIHIDPARRALFSRLFRPMSQEHRDHCDALTASFDDVFELAAGAAEREIFKIEDWQNASKGTVAAKTTAAIRELAATRNHAIVADATRVAEQEIYAIEWWPSPKATVSARVAAAIRRMKLS
jgi:hypothetical protein